MQRFYFDHNATTPIHPEVLSAMTECLAEVYGNASSIHHFGQAAKQRLEAARRQIAARMLCDPRCIVFTSGGTESDNLAILGLRPAHVITSAIEHPAVLNTCAQLDATFVPVGSDGIIDPDDVRRALRPETGLISVMHANNELGTVQPLDEIAAIAHQAGIPLHSDGVQAFGKLPLPAAVDLYSVSGHKLNAPKGIGALYVRQGTPLHPISYGGHHERERRPGTENVPGAVAFGRAADLDFPGLAPLRDRLELAVLDRIPNTRVNGHRTHRTPNTTNITFDGIEGEALVIALDLRGFAVSSGAACSSGAVEPSHVLTAIGLSKQQARSSLRFSLGLGNTMDQIDALVEALTAAVSHLRKIAPAYA